jgi:hypothetical protein
MTQPISELQSSQPFPRCLAFQGLRKIADGPLDQVALAARASIQSDPSYMPLVFDAVTSHVIDLDLRGDEEVVRRHVAVIVRERWGAEGGVAGQGPRGPGRPRLGVVAREVTLLPRHWEWLNRQPGGASAALRRLVDQARKANEGKDRVREAQESAYRFMSAMAGDEPGFEEATRALFAGRGDVFDALVRDWPQDVRDHTRELARPVFAAAEAADGPGSEATR